MEKYLGQDLHRNRIDFPRLVFLMTDLVERQVGQQYFFHIPH